MAESEYHKQRENEKFHKGRNGKKNTHTFLKLELKLFYPVNFI